MLDGVNYTNSEMIWFMSILLQFSKDYPIHNTTVLITTPQVLIENLFGSEVSKKKRENLMKDFNSLYSKNLFTINSDKTTKIKWNQCIYIDVAPMIHEISESFVTLEMDTIETVFSLDLKNVPTALGVYLDIISYINMGDVKWVDEEEFDLNYYNTKKDRPHIDCWASLDTLCSKKHSMGEREDWISQPTLIKYIKMLVDLGLLCVVKPNVKNSKEHFNNHYCLPRHKDLVQQLANRDAHQFIYSRNGGSKN